MHSQLHVLHLKTYLFVRTGVGSASDWVVTFKRRYINFWMNEWILQGQILQLLLLLLLLLLPIPFPLILLLGYYYTTINKSLHLKLFCRRSNQNCQDGIFYIFFTLVSRRSIDVARTWFATTDIVLSVVYTRSFIQKFIRRPFKESTQRRPQPNHGDTAQS